MRNLNALIQERELAALLSPAYARYAGAVKEGLVTFLSILPEGVLEDILTAQVRLGQGGTVSQRLGHLARCSPVLQKLAQSLARNQELARPLRAELQKLEWLPPSFSPAAIEDALRREVGPLEVNHIRLAPFALAEASVAIVIPFARKDLGKCGQTPAFNGVLKLLKPGIEDRLFLELDALRAVGDVLDEKCEKLAIPALKYQEIFSQVAESLQQEILLEQEQQHLLEAATCYANQPQIRIPRLLQPCSSRVTAMERIWGCKLDAAAIDSQSLRRRLADLVVQALVVQPVFAATEKALFHGDPHAGNIFYTSEGQLALLDWSQAGHLRAGQRRLFSLIMLAAYMQQPKRICRLITELAEKPVPDPAGLQRVVESSLMVLAPGSMPGFSWLVSLFDATVREVSLRFPTNVLFFRKSLLTIAGIVEELSGAKGRLDTVVMLEFMSVLAEEWPWRWHFGAFGGQRTSHLSNFDLLEAAAAGFVHPSLMLVEYWQKLYASSGQS